MKSFWFSWYHEQSFGAFELHSPWWVSGSTETANTVCAAVRAEDEEHAKRLVIESFDTAPTEVEWRFVEERPADWSPFTDRFPRARWMKWEAVPA